MVKEIIEELEEIRKEFNEINDGNFTLELKNKEFDKLMNTMEDTFKISWLLKHDLTKLSEEVFSLYQEVNSSRIFQ